MKLFPDHYPIIHISAHGAQTGIQLSSSETLTWSQLREFLVPINASLEGALLLCMSACHGYSACQMAMQEAEVPHPYFAMVGNFGMPLWSDTAVGYLTFYHLLAKGRSIPDAVEAMKAASGNDDWGVETAENSKQGYLDFLKSQASPAEAQHQLEVVAEMEPVPADAKALETGVRTGDQVVTGGSFG